MKALSSRATRGLNIGSILIATDNSGARIVKRSACSVSQSPDNGIAQLCVRPPC